jgi:hypothetical protein
MLKKGQLTIILILSLLIILSTVLFFSNRYHKSQSLRGIDAHITIELLEDRLKECTKKHLHDTLHEISQRSGYYLQEERIQIPHTYQENKQIPHLYMYNSDIFMPSEETVEDSISKLLSEKISACSNGNTKIPNVFASVSFEDSFITVDITGEISFILSEETFSKRSIKLRQENDMGKLYAIAKEHTTMQSSLHNHICISCMQKIAEQNNISMSFLKTDYDNSSLYIFNLHSEKDNISFIYGHEYDHMSRTEPAINIPPEINIPVHYPYSHTLSSNIKGTFYDDSDLFDIDSHTGKFIFTPNFDDLGEHIIKFWIIDSLGRKDIEYVKIIINNTFGNVNLQYPAQHTAKIGTLYLYEPNLDGEKYYFFHDTQDVVIDYETGILAYFPLEEETITFNLTIVDEKGDFRIQTMEVHAE